MRIITLILVSAVSTLAQIPGTRVLMDAHNCYPQDGKWANRIQRALSAGVPLAVEQDLHLFQGKVVVAHDAPAKGGEPTVREYFFERIRPLMEKALKEKRREQWPLIVLNLDFKSNERPLLEALWKLLGEYESWITTARRGADIHKLEPLDVKPLLVLAGDAEEQERAFFDEVPVGAKLRLFGAARVVNGSRWDTPPEMMVPARADNYRRWWNNPWPVVEEGGQYKAGDWTSEDEQRLHALVTHAHDYGYWIRFYTLNGYTPEQSEELGTGRGYNFRSLDAAMLRWQAANRAGVDFIASDMYEQMAETLHHSKTHTSGRLR